MAKWDMSKLPDGRKPLPDEWFRERAQMQERIEDLEAKLAKAVAILTDIRDVAAISEGTQWYAMMADKVLDK